MTLHNLRHPAHLGHAAHDVGTTVSALLLELGMCSATLTCVTRGTWLMPHIKQVFPVACFSV
jgi:hypothetical protein